MDSKFRNYTLSNKEIEQILEKKEIKKHIIKRSCINGEINEDLMQEIKCAIFKVLSKNRKK